MEKTPAQKESTRKSARKYREKQRRARDALMNKVAALEAENAILRQRVHEAEARHDFLNGIVGSVEAEKVEDFSLWTIVY